MINTNEDPAIHIQHYLRSRTQIPSKSTLDILAQLSDSSASPIDSESSSPRTPDKPLLPVLKSENMSVDFKQKQKDSLRATK